MIQRTLLILHQKSIMYATNFWLRCILNILNWYTLLFSCQGWSIRPISYTVGINEEQCYLENNNSWSIVNTVDVRWRWQHIMLPLKSIQRSGAVVAVEQPLVTSLSLVSSAENYLLASVMLTDRSALITVTGSSADQTPSNTLLLYWSSLSAVLYNVLVSERNFVAFQITSQKADIVSGLWKVPGHMEPFLNFVQSFYFFEWLE